MNTGDPLVPPDHDRQWLLDQLASLIRRHGFETFVTAPLLEPTDVFFPDPWAPTAEGVRTVARRLLRYADLADLRAVVAVGEGTTATGDLDPHGRDRHQGHSGAAAWFAGLAGRTCLFGVDVNQIAQPDSLVGVMGHEVAHAYRDVHRLVVADRDLEEQLTDLTTVYLGMGVLLANSAESFRTSGEWRGGGYESRWSHARTGYLGPQALCFLLAAQCLARGLDARERRDLARHLSPNQAGSFRASLALLERDPTALLDHLLIPPREAWPAPRDLAPLTAPLPEDDPDACDPDEWPSPSGAGDEALRLRTPAVDPYAHPVASRVLTYDAATLAPVTHAPRDEPEPALRDEPPVRDDGTPIAARRVSSGRVLGSIAGAVLAGVVARFAEAEMVGCLWVGVALGAIAGSFVERARCGAAGCDARVTMDDDACPRCNATLLPSDHPWLPAPP